jgi:hypothetical protein
MEDNANRYQNLLVLLKKKEIKKNVTTTYKCLCSKVAVKITIDMKYID